jgi:hypothetical protein
MMALLMSKVRMVVPVGGENRAVEPLGNLAASMGELVQSGGVSSRDSVVMARQNVLLDDVPISRGANDTAQNAASGLVLGSQGGFLGGLPGPANEEGSSAAANAFVQGSDWSNWFSSAVGGLGLLDPTPGLLNPEPMLSMSRSHYDELAACKDMLGKLLPEYQNLENKNAALQQEVANLQSRLEFDAAAHANERQVFRQTVEKFRADFERGKAYLEQQVCLEREQMIIRLSDLAKKHAEELEKLKEANTKRIAQIHLENAQDDWYNDVPTRPRVVSASSSNPVVYDMNV